MKSEIFLKSDVKSHICKWSHGSLEPTLDSLAGTGTLVERPPNRAHAFHVSPAIHAFHAFHASPIFGVTGRSRSDGSESGTHGKLTDVTLVSITH